MSEEKSYINHRDENGDIETPPTYRRQLRVGKALECGCCGNGFGIWEGYIDQDQDNGYGICRSCQVDISAHHQQATLDGIKVLRAGLSEENQKKLDGMDLEQQELILAKAFNGGIIKWKIG